MAETTYVIHNMFREHSSHEQRARAAVPHTAVERVAGRRILPKKPIRISAETFKKHAQEILQKVREGRLGVTCPDLSFIDSRPDGRLFTAFLDKKIDEEPVTKLEDLPKDVVSGSDPVPYSDPPGPRTEPEHSPQPPTEYPGTDEGWDGGPKGAVGEPGIPAVEPVPLAEGLTEELEKPDEVLVQASVPPVQENQIITVDMPKSKKRRKE